jgi:hypothetical protein
LERIAEEERERPDPITLPFEENAAAIEQQDEIEVIAAATQDVVSHTNIAMARAEENGELVKLIMGIAKQIESNSMCQQENLGRVAEAAKRTTNAHAILKVCELFLFSWLPSY